MISRFPLHVLWQITNLCNLRCSHCSANGGASPADELSLEQVLSIMDDLRSAGVIDLAFSGGEPLLRPDIREVLDAAVKKGFRVGIGTNGWNTGADFIDMATSCGIHRVQVSIDGLEKSHDRIRMPGSFQRALGAVESAVSAGLNVHICFTPQRRNAGDFETLAYLAADIGISLFNVSQFVPTGRGSMDDDLSPSEWNWVMEKWKRLRDELGHRMKFRAHLAQLVLLDPDLDCRQEFIGCAAGRGQACITPEGYVTPCVLIPVPVGDLRKNSFKEIWGGSPLIKRLKDDRSFGGKCRDCVYINKCGGCRATSLAYNGDIFGEDPHCWFRLSEGAGL